MLRTVCQIKSVCITEYSAKKVHYGIPITPTQLYVYMFAQLQVNCCNQVILCHLKLVCAHYLKCWGYRFITESQNF